MTHTCKSKKSSENMVLYIYDELPEEEKSKFEKHIRECQTCAKEFHNLEEDYGKMNRASRAVTVPELDWSKSWWIIRRTLREQAGKRRSLLPLGRWALKFAAGVIVFAVGIFTGKILFSPSPEPHSTEAFRNPDHFLYLASMYREHFEDVKTTVMEYANYRVGDKESQLLLFEKERVKSLLSRNRLLRSYIKGEEFFVLKQLLDELEMILIEISNLTADRPEYLLFIKNLLKEKEIIFKMKYLKLEKLGSSDI